MLLLNWYLLGVEMNLGHGHKTRFWYLLWVLSLFVHMYVLTVKYQ